MFVMFISFLLSKNKSAINNLITFNRIKIVQKILLISFFLFINRAKTDPYIHIYIHKTLAAEPRTLR